MFRIAVVPLLIVTASVVVSCGGLATNTEAAEPVVSLKKKFAAPPSEYRALPISHHRHLPNPKFVDWLSERRAGGVVLAVPGTGRKKGPEPHIDPTYMDDPVVFEQLRDLMTRLKANDKKVWIYDELYFPSGSAGGRVLDGHPEYAARAVRCRSLKTSGEPLKIASEGKKLLSCRAFRHRDGALDLESAVDLTGKARAGAFTWKPPAGNWTVCLFEHFTSDYWKRLKIRRHINIMDRKAVARFIKLTHERYAKELGPLLDEVVLFFTDEPHLSCNEPWGHGALMKALPAVQWCEELPVAFEREKGYPLVDVIVALFHDIGPSTARYRHDFYDVYSDLIAENYFGQIQDWCRKHKVYSSGHLLLEESLLFGPMFNGSLTKNWARQDLPGVDQLFLPRYKTMAGWNRWGSSIRVKEDFSVKMAASIAALTGKQGVFSESYALAARARAPNLAQSAKGVAAWQFACGVTHMATYTLQWQLSAEGYAGVADFVGRLALLCRRGQPVSDVAVLAPEASVWAFFNPPSGGTYKRYFECNREVMQIDDGFRETCHQLLANQRDFEVFTEELLGKAIVNKGRLELAGQRFAFLVLPEARMLSGASIKKVEAFAASGGRVIFTGSLPYMSPAKGEDAAMRKRAEALMASHTERTQFVKTESNFGQTVKWMAKQVPPVIRWNGQAAVRLAHQRESGREIILVANPSGAAVQGKLVCAFGGGVSVWNPETGKIREVGKRKPEEAVDVAVPEDSARFVVFETSKQ